MTFRHWIILRYDMARGVWHEVGTVEAPTAGEAFKMKVLPPPNVATLPLGGEYRVLSLEDSAHIAVEFNLRDLDYKEPLADAGQSERMSR